MSTPDLGQTLIAHTVQGLLICLALVTALASPADAYPLEESVNVHDVKARVVELVNAERAEHELPAVRISQELSVAAQAHAEDMAERGYFSHTTPEGKRAKTRAAEQDYEAYGGENIAHGQPTPEAVVAAWMNSPGHRRNILNPEHTEIGPGYHPGEEGTKAMWVTKFGQEVGA